MRASLLLIALIPAASALAAVGPALAVKLGERGVLCADGTSSAVYQVSVPPVTPVDTTGAGDMFAAGFLAGLARGRDMKTCGRLGVMAAAEIIQHLGARPTVSLAELARRNGLTV